MFTLSHFATPCPEPVTDQILQLVVDNLTDISSVALPPSNPLFAIYQYAVGYEVHLYLQALDGRQHRNRGCDHRIPDEQAYPDQPQQHGQGSSLGRQAA